jgi:ankyrin repeat protein
MKIEVGDILCDHDGSDPEVIDSIDGDTVLIRDIYNNRTHPGSLKVVKQQLKEGKYKLKKDNFEQHKKRMLNAK